MLARAAGLERQLIDVEQLLAAFGTQAGEIQKQSFRVNRFEVISSVFFAFNRDNGRA